MLIPFGCKNANFFGHKINSYSASRDNWCTGTLWNRIITAQCEGMEKVGSARYEPALLPPCPSIRVLRYSNCQRSSHSMSATCVMLSFIRYVGAVLKIWDRWTVKFSGVASCSENFHHFKISNIVILCWHGNFENILWIPLFKFASFYIWYIHGSLHNILTFGCPFIFATLYFLQVDEAQELV